MSMVENISKMVDVSGLPKIEMRSPRDFFAKVEEEARDLAVWVGELVKISKNVPSTTRQLTRCSVFRIPQGYIHESG